jgi:hypothetical protein
MKKTTFETFNNLYFSPDIIVVNKLSRAMWHAAYISEIRNMYDILVGKPDRKKIISDT